MPDRKKGAGLFPALLKYWRGRRGMSQLDLALAADVSARHVSFLETGRAKPSEEMVLCLGATLEAPLRDQNAMLQAAGFNDHFAEANTHGHFGPSIERAIERMLSQHEPFPMIVMDNHYNMLKSNSGAQRLINRVLLDPSAIQPPLNVMSALFDPQLARPFIADWEKLAHSLLSRLHREALHRPHDTALTQLLEQLLSYPDVPPEWRQPDFSAPSDAALSIRFQRDELDLSFLTTVTAFNAPQNVSLEELRIESYFPIDENTEQACLRLAEADTI